MEIRKKFLENVTVVRVEINPFVSGEGSVLLRVVNEIISSSLFLDCFIGYWVEGNNYKLGETTCVELHLLNWAWKNKIPDKKEKEIKYIKKTPVAVNAYILTGEILDIFESKYEDSYNAIIDCDIYVKLRILKDQNFKIGDYIQAEGRLDAFKVDVVEGCE